MRVDIIYIALARTATLATFFT